MIKMWDFFLEILGECESISGQYCNVPIFLVFLVQFENVVIFYNTVGQLQNDGTVYDSMFPSINGASGYAFDAVKYKLIVI